MLWSHLICFSMQNYHETQFQGHSDKFDKNYLQI